MADIGQEVEPLRAREEVADDKEEGKSAREEGHDKAGDREEDRKTGMRQIPKNSQWPKGGNQLLGWAFLFH